MRPFSPFAAAAFAYPIKLVCVWLLFEGAVCSIGSHRISTHGFGLCALFLWFMGALRFVAWTFGLPIDLMAFDSVFNWTFQIYGASFCIFYTLLLVLRKPLNATKDRE